MQKKFEVGDRVYVDSVTNGGRKWENMFGTVCRYTEHLYIIVIDHSYGYKVSNEYCRTDYTESIWFVTEENDKSTWDYIDETVKGEVKYVINLDLSSIKSGLMVSKFKNSKLARKMYPNSKITECGEWIYV